MQTTPPMEDYLRAIHRLQADDGRALTSHIAEAMEVSQASVTSMVKRLANAGLVEHEAYKGVTLTSAGERVATEVTRHHRLLELFLSQELGMAWDQVHEEADRLEHHISEELEAAIAEKLGNPTVDPHGDPIPTVELEWPATRSERLTSFDPDELVEVRRVTDQSPETLRALSDAGLVPGATVTVVDHAEAVGVTHLVVDGRQVQISSTVARTILARRATTHGTETNDAEVST